MADFHVQYSDLVLVLLDPGFKTPGTGGKANPGKGMLVHPRFHARVTRHALEAEMDTSGSFRRSKFESDLVAALLRNMNFPIPQTLRRPAGAPTAPVLAGES